jgi:mRNA interferase RelE/StbE
MRILFDRSFSKSLDKLKDKQVRGKLKDLIIRMEKAESLNDLPAIKKMKGHTGFYRVRIGDFRVGFELTNSNEIILILIAHRKDIYKRFP